MVLFVMGLSLFIFGASSLREVGIPSGLKAQHNGICVQLRWKHNPKEKIAGYNIYRSGRLIKKRHKINQSICSAASFRDSSLFNSQVVYYQVTTVDVDGKESFPSPPVEVKYILFDKNNIISDQELFNNSAMNLQQIQEFLIWQGSALACYMIDGKTAAQHIYDACQQYKVNPCVVFVTLQKEQRLITSTIVTQQQLNWAMGWGEPSDFVSQINRGTEQFRRYYDFFRASKKEESNLKGYKDEEGILWSAGYPHRVHDGIITPCNIATTGLYVYTPWVGQGGGGQKSIGGNYLFWDLWYNKFQFNEKYQHDGTTEPYAFYDEQIHIDPHL
jgi:hypothetical protein